MLPHVVDRPLSLVRCPQGAGGDCFFQKHASQGFPKEFKPVRIKEKSGSDIYLYIEDERGLVACVQMGVLELHIWGSHVKTLEKPDRVVFDFDPDEDIDFDRVNAAAKEMRDRLKALGLTSFPMATGGKGIHVVVPLTPRDDWEAIKDFAEAMARTIAAEEPDRYLAVATKSRGARARSSSTIFAMAAARRRSRRSRRGRRRMRRSPGRWRGRRSASSRARMR